MEDVTLKWILETVNIYCMVYPFFGITFFLFVFNSIPLIMIVWASLVWTWGIWYYVRRIKLDDSKVVE